MNPEIAIGIDVGGTNIQGVLINKSGEILERANRETEKKGVIWRDRVHELLNELQKKTQADMAVGLSAPGVSNKLHDAIAYMPGRLDGLQDLKWADFLNVDSVKVLNDAHAALLAESTFGSGQGISNLVMLTLGTGIGGGVMINGSFYEGFHGTAGHFGHASLDAESRNLGITNMPGSLEDAFCESSVDRRSHGKFQSTKKLVAAYTKGDHFATYLWLKSVRELAVGICSICNTLSPEMVILGGGISNAKESLFEPLESFMDLYEWRPGGNKTIIQRAHFNEYAGAIGAATFAFQHE